MDLSIIIPTLNRSAYLTELLASLKKVEIPDINYEILVVDNGSEDDTKRVVKANRHNNIQYLFEPKPGLHNARHCGVCFSRGQWLAFLDDDTLVCEYWLTGIAESISEPDVVLLTGKISPLFETTPPDWAESLWKHCEFGKICSCYSLCDFGDSIIDIPANLVWGCNFVIKKSVLLKFNGFHPDAMPEEYKFQRGDGETGLANKIRRANLRAIYNHIIAIKHRVPKSRLHPDYIYKRGYLQGISDSYSLVRTRQKKGTDLITYIKNLYKFVKSDFCNVSFMNENIKIQAQYYKGYLKGFYEHQAEIEKDEDLFEWVIKANYLNHDSN